MNEDDRQVFGPSAMSWPSQKADAIRHRVVKPAIPQKTRGLVSGFKRDRFCNKHIIREASDFCIEDGHELGRSEIDTELVNCASRTPLMVFGTVGFQREGPISPSD